MTTAASTASMNRIYRRQRHIYDLTRKYFLLGRDTLIDRLVPAPGDAVLEIGCGTARNLIKAARRYPDAFFFGVDVSTEMLTSARAKVEHASLDARVRLAHADATAFNPQPLFGRAQFERIFLSYSISMIPGWEAAIDRALALLAPGGMLLIVDFGPQRRLPAAFRRALRRWLALFEVTPRDNLSLVLAARADAKADVAVEPLYSDYAQLAVLTTRAA